MFRPCLGDVSLVQLRFVSINVDWPNMADELARKATFSVWCENACLRQSGPLEA